jgi:hypothetical protein
MWMLWTKQEYIAYFQHLCIAHFVDPVPTTKKTQKFSIRNINWLMLFIEINNRCLLWESYETHKYTMGKMKSYR